MAGSFPLTHQQIETVTQITKEEPFGNIQVTGGGAFVLVPGWQAILKATDPVGYFVPSDCLTTSISGKVEQVLVIIDQASQKGK